MAGDWVKMRHDLYDDPGTVRIAKLARLDRDAVIGKLHRVWSWADRHTFDGRACDVGGADFLDALVGVDGFASAMVAVGWLIVDGDCFEIPNFDRHNGETAKKRALSNKRKQAFRAKNEPHGVAERSQRSKSVPSVERSRRSKKFAREEKRREDTSSLRSEEFPPPHAGAHARAGEEPDPEAGRLAGLWAELVNRWNGAGWVAPYRPLDAIPPDFFERVETLGWGELWPAALARLEHAKFFERPVTLTQFLRGDFAHRVMAGEFDTKPRARPSARPDAPMTLDEKLARDRRESARKPAWRDAPAGCPEDLAGEFFNRMMTEAEYQAARAKALEIHRARAREASLKAQESARRLREASVGSPEPPNPIGPYNASQGHSRAPAETVTQDDDGDLEVGPDPVRDGWVGRDGLP